MPIVSKEGGTGRQNLIYSVWNISVIWQS